MDGPVILESGARSTITYDKGRSRKITIASAITYRILSTILLAIITYSVTGKLADSLLVTVIFATLATILYYYNDRAWERYGRPKKSAT